jgi:predicted membrane chloride channel (bestrophin family)
MLILSKSFKISYQSLILIFVIHPCDFFSGFAIKSPNVLHFVNNRFFSYSLFSTRYYYTDNNKYEPKKKSSFHPKFNGITNSSSFSLNDSDSIEDFARDVAIVLKTLRSEERDPSIPRTFRIARMPSFTSTWSFEDWKKHTSRKRYLYYFTNIPTSFLLRRLAPSMAILLLWSCFASWAFSHEVAMVQRAVLSLTPLSLVSTFVAALLTLRSNQGLDRLNAGRLALGKVVLYTRDMAQMTAAHVYPRDPYLGLKLARHVAIFSWLLKGFLRGPQVNGSDEDIIRTMLDPIDADYVLKQRKKPVAIVTRLHQVFSHMIREGQLTTSEASRLDHTVQQLNHCIMVAERIQASPIPPLYTAHTGRLLMFYLIFFPLSLRGSNVMNAAGTIITTMAVGYAMLGLDEISHLVEEPFRLMPLWHLSKNSMIDCADAFVCQPPPLFKDSHPARFNQSNVERTAQERPQYW